MSDVVEGVGEASDAAVSLDARPDAPEVADGALVDAQNRVVAAETKVTRQREHLAAAEHALEQAQAELADVTKDA